MRNTSIFKVFLKYVSLNILGQMAYSCYTLADTFFVSASLGANGLTALNLAFPVFCLINGTGLMIGMGGGTRYSILKSRGEDDRANRVFTNAVYLVAFFSALFATAGLLFSGTIVRLLGADDTVYTPQNSPAETEDCSPVHLSGWTLWHRRRLSSLAAAVSGQATSPGTQSV